MAELRDYQQASLDKVRDAVRSGFRRVVLQSPTGSGKTRIASEIVHGARGKANKVIFTVPAISLIDQTVEEFYREGISDIGVIQAKHRMTDWARPIQIASVQTLCKCERIPDAAVVIHDECHRLHKFNLAWLQNPEWNHVPFIGLSATPWTRGLGRYYDKLVVGATTRELIDKGYLSPFRVFAPTHPDLRGVQITAGDYNETQLSKAMNQEKLTADIVETWKERAIGRPTICFAVDCEHAQALQERFKDASISAAYMDARTPLNERKEIQNGFERGEVEVVCNVDVMGMGVDWPGIQCISYCRPTRSEIRFVQNIGRGLRRSEGKEDLLILDHSDTTLRLGFVTDIHHATLSHGKEATNGEKRVALPRSCPKCSLLLRLGEGKCPNCGTEPKQRERVQIGTAPGELIEYQELKAYKGKREQFSMADKRVFFAELLGYAQERGFKRGWAANKYREKFDVWPRLMDNVYPVKPSTNMRLWIKSRMIAWVKSKQQPRKENPNNWSDYVDR
jgi:DNA repair protein RadD